MDLFAIHFLTGIAPSIDGYHKIADTLVWPDELGTPPTQQEIDDALADLTIVNGQTFSQWRAEHGGDPVLTLQRKAKELLDAEQAEAALTRAALKELVVYARDAHRNLNTLLDGIAAAGNLNDVKTTAAGITQASAPADEGVLFQGARDAVKARLDAGEVNS